MAQDGYLVTLGIPPTGPDTGFGYIQSGEAIREDPGLGVTVHRVQQFKEKPKKAVAEQYLREGGYFWNAGMYIATVRTLRDLYRTHLPQMEDGLRPDRGRARHARRGEGAAPGLPDAGEDLGGLRHLREGRESRRHPRRHRLERRRLLGPAGRGAGRRRATRTENIVIGHHIGVDTQGALIYSPHRLIATIGLEDIIVIDTPDATLICPKSRSEDVKKIVEELKARGHQHLL